MTLANPRADKGFFGDAAGPVGDFNGDGFLDAVVGAPAQSAGMPQSGAVYLFFGTGQVLMTPSLSIPNPVGETGALFGAGLSR